MPFWGHKCRKGGERGYNGKENGKWRRPMEIGKDKGKIYTDSGDK